MRISKLDGLRGIFSLMVVVFHYPKEYAPDWFYNFFLFRESYSFVDFFFVLSGYVIAFNYHSLSNMGEFWLYLKKRFIRLYPLLFFSTTLMFVYLLAHDFIARTVIVNIRPDLFDQPGGYDIYEHFLVYIPKYLDSILFLNSTPILGKGNTNLGINGPSWSISSEMISYAAFGLLTVFLSKRMKKIALFLMIVGSLAFLYQTGMFFQAGDYGFLRGFVCFNMGYFVWELSRYDFKVNNSFEYLIPLLLVVIFYWLNHLGRDTPEGLNFSIVVPIFFSLSILTLLKTDGVLSEILDSKLFQYLGKLSYSMYLNHAILLLVILKPLYRIFNIQHTVFNELLIFVIVCLITIFYSHFTFKYVEMRGSKFLKAKLLKK